MTPIVSVPMNFGIHLLESPTHSTLELQAKNGAKVRASSMILSFNSPVVDHMTTILHLTTLDMEEFSEEAVRYFVHAAYSGETPPISRDMFRDLNKMSHVFNVSWLTTRCVQLFSSLADSIIQPSYDDFLFIFEEAVFALSKSKSGQLVDIVFKKIRSFNWTEQFISHYLKDLNSLSLQQLDLVLELSGHHTLFIVKPSVGRLTSMSEGDMGIPENFKYLIDQIDVFRARMLHPELMEQLFDKLQDLATEKGDLTWVFQVSKKANKSGKLSTKFPLSKSVSTPPASLKVAPNLFHTIDRNMTYDELWNWLEGSDEVTNLLMFLEGQWTWMCLNQKDSFSWPHYSRMKNIIIRSSWEPLCNSDLLHFTWSNTFFKQVQGYDYVVNSKVSTGRFTRKYNEIKCSLQSVFVDGKKLLFRHKHPKVLCKTPSRCGFILKAAPAEEDGLATDTMMLCTDPSEYSGTGVHYHEELCAENIIHLTLYQETEKTYIPMSWIGLPKVEENQFTSFTSLLPNIDFVNGLFHFCAIISL